MSAELLLDQGHHSEAGQGITVRLDDVRGPYKTG